MCLVDVELERLADVTQVFYGFGEPLEILPLKQNTGTEKRGEHLFDIFNMSDRVLGKLFRN